MPFGFIDRVAGTNALKDGMDISTQRTRMISDRVAKASLQAPDAFVLPGVNAKPGSPENGPVDLESEMVSLADEQLRYEATAKLLQDAYKSVRSSIKE